jgi:hypothetical protein
MDTTYEDITDAGLRSGQGFQQVNPFVICELQKAYRGRFCFPFGAGFGCGLELTLSAGAEANLMTQFNVPPLPVRATLTFKVAVEVVYKSHRCEYCRPKVCVEATIDVWKCERFLGFWSWTTIDTVFTPSIQPIFLTDCTPNDPLCNCPQRTAMLRIGEEGEQGRFALLDDDGGREAQARGIGEMATASVLVSPASFGEAGIALLRSHQEAAWISGGPSEGPPKLTLLSRGAWDVGRLRVNEGLPRLPILAATQPVPTAERKAHKPEKVFEGNAFVVTERATTVWVDADLSKAGLQAGTRGQVIVTLRDKSKRTISTLSAPFVVTPKWGGLA